MTLNSLDVIEECLRWNKGETMKYKIVRVYQEHDRRSRVIKRGITKKQAVAHCNKGSSRGSGWFDTWTKE